MGRQKKRSKHEFGQCRTGSCRSGEDSYVGKQSAPMYLDRPSLGAKKKKSFKGFSPSQLVSKTWMLLERKCSVSNKMCLRRLCWTGLKPGLWLKHFSSHDRFPPEGSTRGPEETVVWEAAPWRLSPNVFMGWNQLIWPLAILFSLQLQSCFLVLITTAKKWIFL